MTLSSVNNNPRQVFLLLRNAPMLDTFRKRFDAPGEKCQLEMQVQGRFRKLPEGRLFMGAEISKRMDLGLLTKGLSNRCLP